MRGRCAPAVRWQLPGKRDSMISQIEVSTLAGKPRHFNAAFEVARGPGSPFQRRFSAVSVCLPNVPGDPCGSGDGAKGLPETREALMSRISRAMAGTAIAVAVAASGLL